MAGKRQEDQVPWLFFFVMFQSRCGYFPSVRFLHSTWEGLAPFFRGRTSTSSSTTMRIMSDDDKYLWVYDLHDFTMQFYNLRNVPFQGNKVLTGCPSRARNQSIFLPVKNVTLFSEIRKFNFPFLLIYRIIFCAEDFSQELFIGKFPDNMSVLRLKKTFLFSEIRKF